ncbi:MAG: hypothetical protein VYA61_03165, partial [Pseudomonadota bacterium]|nr:hypothetical protein [Pseudomonadota bacterium]
KCNPYTILFNLNEYGYQIEFETAAKFATEVRRHLSRKKGHYLMEVTELIEFYKKSCHYKNNSN